MQNIKRQKQQLSPSIVYKKVREMVCRRAREILCHGDMRRQNRRNIFTEFAKQLFFIMQDRLP